MCAVQTRGEDLAVTYLNLVRNKISKISINLDMQNTCRESMLLGTFARNQFSQFSDALTTEKSQALTWQ